MIVDVSGSMEGNRIQNLKTAMNKLVSTVKGNSDIDARVSIVSFSDIAGAAEADEMCIRDSSEYRETEDAMRTTLLTAQKMANSMVVQAEEEKKRMIAEAERAALQRKAEVEQEVADAEYQLKMAKNATAQFAEGMRELVKQESAFLDQLPAIKAEPIHPKKAEPAPAPVAPEAEAAKDEPAEAKSDDCIDQILQEEADRCV